ncbi:MAG TPA: hypothetical protein VFP72_19135 [Kineosporiaceae bacterium]|nr:hypothetical protein [Kineosporiaceae bacterium]
MDTATPEERRIWGVRCGDGEVLWVEDEAAAHRLLVSLVGAEQIVYRGEHAGAGHVEASSS